MTAKQRLDELEKAADEYFAKERTRLEAEYTFLDNIAKRRRGNAALQDLNSEGASAILVDSINEYLGRPLG
jgi:adenine C2-methylase RlmN of 23S rRNA A2503 and tRNA A37